MHTPTIARRPVALCAVLLFAACGGGGDGRSTDPSELEPLLVTEVAPGYAVQPDHVGDTGPSDLEKAVRDQGGTEADRAFLVDHGYRRGYQRLWTDDDANPVVVFLYEFDDEEGATAEAALVPKVITSSETPEPSFVIDDIKGSAGFMLEEPAAPGCIVLLTKGGFVVQVYVGLEDEPAARSIAEDVARKQYDRLPS